ncbi:MAG: hypothetical protein ACOCXQ_00965 [Patescibacteria group bacterium]
MHEYQLNRVYLRVTYIQESELKPNIVTNLAYVRFVLDDVHVFEEEILTLHSNPPLTLNRSQYFVQLKNYILQTDIPAGNLDTLRKSVEDKIYRLVSNLREGSILRLTDVGSAEPTRYAHEYAIIEVRLVEKESSPDVLVPYWYVTVARIDQLNPLTGDYTQVESIIWLDTTLSIDQTLVVDALNFILEYAKHGFFYTTRKASRNSDYQGKIKIGRVYENIKVEPITRLGCRITVTHSLVEVLGFAGSYPGRGAFKGKKLDTFYVRVLAHLHKDNEFTTRIQGNIQTVLGMNLVGPIGIREKTGAAVSSWINQRLLSIYPTKNLNLVHTTLKGRKVRIKLRIDREIWKEHCVIPIFDCTVLELTGGNEFYNMTLHVGQQITVHGLNLVSRYTDRGLYRLDADG